MSGGDAQRNGPERLGGNVRHKSGMTFSATWIKERKLVSITNLA